MANRTPQGWPGVLPSGDRQGNALGIGAAEERGEVIHRLASYAGGDVRLEKGGDTVSEVLQLDRSEEAEHLQGILVPTRS